MSFSFQVSEYLKKQMVAADGGETDEVKNMLQEHDKLVEEIFQHEDKDKNGYISHDEFSGPKHDELWTADREIFYKDVGRCCFIWNFFINCFWVISILISFFI